MDILILGGGEMGHALYSVLSKKNTVSVYDIDAPKCIGVNKETFSECIQNTEVVFLCIPSRYFEDAILSLGDYVSSHAIIISLTKGVIGEGTFSYQVLEKYFAKEQIGILGGPMIAEEIEKGISTEVIVGSSNEVFAHMQSIFDDTTLHISHTTDALGVSMCGVLKNIYVLLLGFLDVKGAGVNREGVFFVRVLKEMKIILRDYGADEKLACSLAGLGDVIATGSSDMSCNLRAGREFGEKGSTDLYCEGIASLQKIDKVIDIEKYKLLQGTKDIFLDTKEISLENLIF